jgi:acyl-CoA thioester hydrolase
MARISLDVPRTFLFNTSIPVRITDLNYGGHVGNDAILSIIHEARMQFLQNYGYSEKNLAGTGMIMGDVAIIFKNEAFYGDVLRVSVTVSDISKVSFDFIYQMEKDVDGKSIIVAQAKTGMICFDYAMRKVTAVPDEIKLKWAAT